MGLQGYGYAWVAEGKALCHRATDALGDPLIGACMRGMGCMNAQGRMFGATRICISTPHAPMHPYIC